MKQIQGKFLLQPNNDFPADCEMLDYMQTNAHIISIIGNLAGDKAVLLGCERNGDNQRKEGYVFLRTKDHPEGEVLFWEGGTTAGGMYLKQESIAVQSHGYDYPEAYVKRWLAPGVGTENYKWNDFHDAQSLPDLQAEIASLETTLDNIRQAPIGSITIWAGKELPANYALCAGQALSQTEYSDLFYVIGTTFNNAADYQGHTHSTSAFEFRLPDLRGRFIVGHNPQDLTDYRTYGQTGGEKTHQLTVREMPVHMHETKDYYYAERKTGGIDGEDLLQTTINGSSATDDDNIYLYYKKHYTEASGANQAHENRPPYYVLAYIMRVK